MDLNAHFMLTTTSGSLILMSLQTTARWRALKTIANVKPNSKRWKSTRDLQMCEFGGLQGYEGGPEQDVRLLLAFPRLKKDIFEKQTLRRWMNDVVIPAIYKSLVIFERLPFGCYTIKSICLESQERRVETMNSESDDHLDLYL